MSLHVGLGAFKVGSIARPPSGGTRQPRRRHHRALGIRCRDEDFPRLGPAAGRTFCPGGGAGAGGGRGWMCSLSHRIRMTRRLAVLE
jgi:hypothetical protein